MTTIFSFLPPEALPPETQSTPALLALGEALQTACNGVDCTPLLRLGSPFGEVVGLALPLPGQELAWICGLAERFAQQGHETNVLAQLTQISQALQHPTLLTGFPELMVRPSPNKNLLWDVHFTLAETPAYPVLATDLHMGLINTLHRTNWAQTPAATKSLDALVTAAIRLIPVLDADALIQALERRDEVACAKVFEQAAVSLTYHKSPDRQLPHQTQIGYLRDCCRLIGHPEWARTSVTDRLLGHGNVSPKRRPPRQDDDDDPPETMLTPDRYREQQQIKLERQTRRELMPGAALEEAAEIKGPVIFGEELAIMREYIHPHQWHCAHPNEIAFLLRWLYEQPRTPLRGLLLAMCLTGRSPDWLRQVEFSPSPRTETLSAQSAPRYVPEWGAIIYFPEITTELSTQMEQTADLFEPVSPFWVLPLPEIVLEEWQALARQRQPGQRLLAVTEEQIAQALSLVTDQLRRQILNCPALTVGRIRAAFTALMEHEVGLDPWLTASISAQWRPALRVPTFYITITTELQAGRYRDACRRLWEKLRQSEPHLPQFPIFELPPLPHFWIGSPYYPKLEVLQHAIQTLHQAMEQAAETDTRHNAHTLLALYGLSALGGLRISEVADRRASDFDLNATWQGKPLPWLVLPTTKGNRWTTAARIVPLPRVLIPYLRSLLPADHNAPAFHLLRNGLPIPADTEEIRQQLAQYQTPFPRWHAGRHWLRSVALAENIPFAPINAILGHQSAGHELFNPYLPDDPSEVWWQYLTLTDHLAQLLHWPEEAV